MAPKTKKAKLTTADEVGKQKTNNSITVYIKQYKTEIIRETTIYKFIGSNGDVELQMITYAQEIDEQLKSLGPLVEIKGHRINRIAHDFLPYRFCDTKYEINLDMCAVTKSLNNFVPKLLYPLPQDTVVTFGRINYISIDIPNMVNPDFYKNVVILKYDSTSEVVHIRRNIVEDNTLQLDDVVSFRCLWKQDKSCNNSIFSSKSWFVEPTPDETEAVSQIDPYKCDVGRISEILTAALELQAYDSLVFSLDVAKIVEVDNKVFFFRHRSSDKRVKFHPRENKYCLDDNTEVHEKDVVPFFRYKFYLSQDDEELEIVVFGKEAERILGITAEQAFNEKLEVDLHEGQVVQFRGYAYCIKKNNNIIAKMIDMKIIKK